MKRRRSPSELLAGALAGEVSAVARLLTIAESGDPALRPVLDAVFARAGRAHVVGITGVPGSGKSTLVSALALEFRKSGRKVGVVAIDPSSPYSGGAVLGDRVRMNALIDDPGVFVRSMATRGALGGLSRGALEAVDVLDAAGYDVVLIETVGVGQDEIDVASAAHTTVVVSAPGLGDDVQAIKAGVLEIADIHVVSKCDRPDANRTIADLKAMLALGPGPGHRPGWALPVLGTSAEKATGIDVLRATIDAHWQFAHDSGDIARRRTRINERRLLKAAEEIVRERLAARQNEGLAALLTRMESREASPRAAAMELLRALGQGDA